MFRLFLFLVFYLFLEGVYAQNFSIVQNIAKLKDNIQEKMHLDGTDKFSPKADAFYIHSFGYIVVINDNSRHLEYRDFQLEDFIEPTPNIKNKKESTNPKKELLLKTQKTIAFDNEYNDKKIRNLILESMDVAELEAHQSIRMIYFESQIDTFNLRKKDAKGNLVIRPKASWELSKKEFDIFKNGNYSKDELLKKIQKNILSKEDSKTTLGKKIFGVIPNDVIQTIADEDHIQYGSIRQHYYFQNSGIYYIDYLYFSEDSFFYSENKKQDFNENLALFQAKIEHSSKESLMYYSYILLPQLKPNESITWYIQFELNKKKIEYIEGIPTKVFNFITISINQSTIELYHSKKISLEDAMKQIKISKY
ncbi:hypothetical protein AD998_04360 [bacterium 336/3]|nr:hypothetical protein AD998_04360 [bacterium 336/3]